MVFVALLHFWFIKEACTKMDLLEPQSLNDCNEQNSDVVDTRLERGNEALLWSGLLNVYIICIFQVYTSLRPIASRKCV